MNRHNNWRYSLDPRDPDYLDLPNEEELEEQAEAEIYVGEGNELFRSWDFDHV